MTDERQRKQLFLVSDLETLRILMDPLRIQILEVLSPEPQTVNQVAEQLGHSSSRLYYHFNLLEEHGLINVVQTRAVNNMIEKLYWTIAENIEIDKALLEFSPKKVQENLFGLITSSLDVTCADMIRSLEARSFNLEHGAKPTPRDMIIQTTRKRLKDETYEKFISQLKSLLQTFSDLPEETGSGEDVNYYSLACYAYPNFYYESKNEQDERR
jgi:DNA-binding transcriptional ArsR family regulator